MGYKVYCIKRNFDRVQDGKFLLEIDHRPEIYNSLKVGDSVYIVRIISDEFKVVGVRGR